MFGISNQMENARTAIYVRISTNQQKTDRQVIELMDFAQRQGIEVNPEDIFIDIISGFKNGEIRPQCSILKQKVESGVYQQILFSEFSRLYRKPSSMLFSKLFGKQHRGRLYGDGCTTTGGNHSSQSQNDYRIP